MLKFKLPAFDKISATKMATPGEDPGRIYQYEELMEQKTRVNDIKKRIEQVDAKQWESSSRRLNHYEHLRKEALIPYDAQFVSNAWIKMWELTAEFVPTLIDDVFMKNKMQVISRGGNGESVKKKITELNLKKELNTFHVAEAPGSFLLALNHWLYSHHPNISWNWIAESYREDAGTRANSQYLGDRYGIMRKYDDRWCYGAEGNGDITSTSNLRSFEHHLPKCHLFTSDVKSPVDNYDEEEAQLYQVHVGHIVAALGTLAKGGLCILKTFSYFEARSINLLFILTQHFEKVYVTKPVTSRPANSETYIVCEDFKGVSDAVMDSLYDHLDEVKTGVEKCIYKQIDVPGTLVDKMVEINEALIKQQDAEIARIVAGIRSNAETPRKDQEHATAEFLTKYPIKKLAAERKL
nr:cap-specific mrna (Nucleoside-2-o-)-methyltransferase 2 isoform [Kaumoebavirus]